MQELDRTHEPHFGPICMKLEDNLNRTRLSSIWFLIKRPEGSLRVSPVSKDKMSLEKS